MYGPFRSASPSALLRAAQDPLNLVVFRVIYLLLLWLRLRRFGLKVIRRRYATGRYHPVPTLASLGLCKPLPCRAVEVLYGALCACLLTGALGLCPGLSCGAAATLYLLVWGHLLGFEKAPNTPYVSHSGNMPFFILIILAMASINSPTLAARDQGTGLHLAPAWPRMLIKATLGLAYLGSAYCKLCDGGGWRWADGYTLQGILMSKDLEADCSPWVRALAANRWLCCVAGALTLFFELTAAFAWLLDDGAKAGLITWSYVVMGLWMHMGILLTTRINFLHLFCYTYVIFIDYATVRPLLAWAAGLMGAPWQLPPSVEPTGSQTADTIGATYTTGVIALAVLCALVGPILLRIEHWPFTDYRMFSKRTHPKYAEAYRIAIGCHKGDGEACDWRLLRNDELRPFNSSVLHLRLKALVVIKDWKSVRKILTGYAAAINVDVQQIPRNRWLVVLHRRMAQDSRGVYSKVVQNEVGPRVVLPRSDTSSDEASTGKAE